MYFILASAEPVTRHPDNAWPAQSDANASSWSLFNPDTNNLSEQTLLQTLQRMQSDGSRRSFPVFILFIVQPCLILAGPSDSTDIVIASLELSATLHGKDLWSLAQTMPHLFSVGGAFYEQVKRDCALVDGKHYSLHSFPGKVRLAIELQSVTSVTSSAAGVCLCLQLFRFNAHDDRLELCLEPFGHFAVEPGIEARVNSSSLIDMTLNRKHLAPGASGVVSGASAMTSRCGSTAFQGDLSWSRFCGNFSSALSPFRSGMGGFVTSCN